MGILQNIVAAAAGVALGTGAAAAAAGPKEPLVVTQMADPDPYFVPPREGGAQLKTDTAANSDENARIEEAMQDFGRAIGQAAVVERQQIEARCRSSQPEDATPEQRFAWAASCRYSRH